MSTRAERKARRNGALFRTIARRIEARPLSYDQSTFGRLGAYDGVTVDGYVPPVNLRYDTLGDCGSVACIAGHALLESGLAYSMSQVRFDPGLTYFGGDPTSRGAKLLGLTTEEAVVLFGGDWRPKGTTDYTAPMSELAPLVADALRKLARGTRVEAVTTTPEELGL